MQTKVAHHWYCKIKHWNTIYRGTAKFFQ